jgi:glutaredoxin
MKYKNGKKKFAYAVGMFPNPKTKKASYLDGCIFAALGLKRQNTEADVICFITHDISKSDKKKLEVVFDKVMYVPYISPYDMGGTGKLKTIMMDPELFDNCPNYTKNHPYVHVFFKLHIFNPKLFPYEKVCFVDSDLVPLNYYDSLFLLDCPAGYVEYRKKIPYLKSHHWDRCDSLKHGGVIPSFITDVDKPTGADVNAGLLLVKPDKKEYDEMIKQLTSPLKTWMGPNKFHKGFYTFNFDKYDGREFVSNSYCYPEQNYLTKRYSGKWKYIEFAFQSWGLDPCNSFGIHMAAFNPKPWFKQPAALKLKIDEQYNPYLNKSDNKIIKIPIAIEEGTNNNYDNISFSYEIFNELILWGLINYPTLCDFFVHETQIHGTKISFDRDLFEPLSKDKNIQFEYLKNIKKKNPNYNRLSLTQKYISDLLNKNKKTYNIVKDNYLQICRSNKITNNGDRRHDFTIINYPEYKVRESVLQFGGSKKKSRSNMRRKNTRRRNTRRRNTRRKNTRRKNTRKQVLPVVGTLYYFTMEGCPYCKEFEPTWEKLLTKESKHLKMKKIDRYDELTASYNVVSFPTLILETEKNKKVNHYNFGYDDERSIVNITSFLKKHEIHI